MNISEIAQKTGLTAKSIRLYEDKGLIKPPSRGENGYRIYSQGHLADLQLIARAKRVGFSLDECKYLVELANDPLRRSEAVKEKTSAKLAQVEEKIAELSAIKQQLELWIRECPGDDSHECPIIDDLKGHCHCD